jgi:hypothetical protein
VDLGTGSLLLPNRRLFVRGWAAMALAVERAEHKPESVRLLGLDLTGGLIP